MPPPHALKKSHLPLSSFSFPSHLSSPFPLGLFFSPQLRLLPTTLLTPRFGFRYCHWGSPHSSLLGSFHIPITQLHKELLGLGTSAGSLMLGLVKYVLKTRKSGVKVKRGKVLADSWEGFRYCVCCFVSTLQSQTVQCMRPQKFDSFKAFSALDENSHCVLEALTLLHTAAEQWIKWNALICNFCALACMHAYANGCVCVCVHSGVCVLLCVHNL